MEILNKKKLLNAEARSYTKRIVYEESTCIMYVYIGMGVGPKQLDTRSFARDFQKKNVQTKQTCH